MERKAYRRRRSGSLVFPFLLIIVGVLLLLDKLNITPGIDWTTVWKLWPLILIAMGLEVILGRRVSFGAIFVVVIIVVISGAAVWWSVAAEDGDRTTEHFAWPMEGVERAELELDLGVGELRLIGYGDMSDLLVADLNLAPSADVSHAISVDADVARGQISSDKPFLSLPAILRNKASEWDLRLNERVSWKVDASSGAGDVRIDLSALRVSDLSVDSGVGSVTVTLPRRGTTRAKLDGGIGDIRVTIPDGVEARIKVDRGIGDLNVGNRFKRQGDYYETSGFSDAESFIDLQVDIGIGSITIR